MLKFDGDVDANANVKCEHSISNQRIRCILKDYVQNSTVQGEFSRVSVTTQVDLLFIVITIKY